MNSKSTDHEQKVIKNHTTTSGLHSGPTLLEARKPLKGREEHLQSSLKNNHKRLDDGDGYTEDDHGGGHRIRKGGCAIGMRAPRLRPISFDLGKNGQNNRLALPPGELVGPRSHNPTLSSSFGRKFSMHIRPGSKLCMWFIGPRW